MRTVRELSFFFFFSLEWKMFSVLGRRINAASLLHSNQCVECGEEPEAKEPRH